jgi:mycothiol synthase
VTPVARPYAGDDDAWRIRAFLRASFLLDGRRQRVWPVARFDYARAHTCRNVAGVALEDVATVWVCAGEIVALLMPDGGPGEAHLSVHPHHRTPAFEASMLDVAEERLSARAADGRRSLIVWAHADDACRVSELVRRGFERTGGAELTWRRDLSRPLEGAPLAHGYSLRSLGHGLDLLERCFASGLAFHDGDTAVALGNRADIGWYESIQSAPLYRRDLDVVAVAPDGAIAAFCTVWFDDATRSAMVEPLAVVPAHRRKGLARAVLTEGLRRAQRLGADLGFVGGQSAAANALYGSVLDDGCERYESWLRRW